MKVSRLILRPLPEGPWARALTLALFYLGAVLCWLFLLTDASWPIPIAFTAVLTALYAVSRWRMTRRWARRARGASIVLMTIVYLFWMYEAWIFTANLAWAVSPWIWGVAAVALVGVVWTGRPSWRYVEVPVVLPLGIAVVGCLGAWMGSQGQIRCDDYRDVVAQPGVTVSMATTEAVVGCEPGDRLSIVRSPRNIWESPEGEYVFTTQAGPTHDSAKPAPGRLSGSICVGSVGPSDSLRCFGLGKAQGIAESKPLDRLFVASWGMLKDPRRKGGHLYALSRSDPSEILVRREVEAQTAELFYDPKGDLLGVLTDEGEHMYPFRASTLQPLEPVRSPVIPNDVHYDVGRREGVFCFAAGPIKTLEGVAYGAVAFRVEPYEMRPLAPASDYPWLWLGFSWGCDWDRERGVVYAAIANLGVLVTIDYQTGELLDTTYVGTGVRTVEHDPERGRLYLGRFFDGNITALDLGTGETAGSWLAGRYVRAVVLSRDGSRLLVSSNLGIVEIELSG